MFTTNNQQASPVRPKLLILLATALGLIASTSLAANPQDRRVPGLLPAEAGRVAKPMEAAAQDALANQLWQAVEDQSAGRWQEAIATWERVALPCERQVWRHLSLGVAYLYLDQHAEAAEQLAFAQQYDAENPAVHYFFGLLHLQRADDAMQYSDAVSDRQARLVRHVVGEDPQTAGLPKVKSRYELEAIGHLETAIEHATHVDFGAPLVPIRWVVPVPYPMTERLAPPTVDDLLASLGADNIAGKAHGMLAQLYLDRSRPDEAEHHTDQAHSCGIAVPYGYRQVGELYEEQGRSTDAFRAYTKAMQHGDRLAKPGAKAFENLRNAFEQLL